MRWKWAASHSAEPPPPDAPTVDKLDLGLALIRKSECESLMIPAFILLNITPAVWTLGAWQWPRVCRVSPLSGRAIQGVMDSHKLSIMLEWVPSWNTHNLDSSYFHCDHKRAIIRTMEAAKWRDNKNTALSDLYICSEDICSHLSNDVNIPALVPRIQDMLHF